MVWQRPVPLIGDTTAASQRAADPTGWAFDEPDRAVLYAVMAGRRDVRRFRADPVAAPGLWRVLGAGHVPGRGPLELRLRQPEPVAGGPRRGTGRGLGHAVRPGRARRPAGPAGRCGDSGLAVPGVAGRAPARAGVAAGRVVAAAAAGR